MSMWGFKRKHNRTPSHTKHTHARTRSTLARLFSNLPRVGNPIRVAVYDLHTLQVHTHAHAHTRTPHAHAHTHMHTHAHTHTPYFGNTIRIAAFCTSGVYQV